MQTDFKQKKKQLIQSSSNQKTIIIVKHSLEICLSNKIMFLPFTQNLFGNTFA